MISFILPATDKTKVKSLSDSLDQLGQPFELLPIYEATSFFDCWRKAVPKAKGDYLCFTHQDTKFNYIPPLKDYLKGDVAMVGVAGTTVIHKDQPWWFSKERLYANLLSGSIKHTGSPQPDIFGKLGNVVILDGVCIITQKDKLLKVGIPDIDWAKWDFYDHIISLEYIKKGYKLQTIPIEMTHDSTGGGQDTFIQNMNRFRDEYLSVTYRA